MLKRLLSVALASLGLLVGQGALAQQPVQWNYNFQSGIATATYPGNVNILGTLTTSGASSANGAATNAALAALPSSLGQVWRNGYYALGDTPPLLYTASGSACSLNAGAGDGGSQIPTSNGGCWLADFPGTVLPQWFGAIGNNVGDQRTTVQAAITAAVTARLPVYLTTVFRVGGPLACAPGAGICNVDCTQNIGGIELNSATATDSALVIGSLATATFNHVVRGCAFTRTQAGNQSSAIAVLNAGVTTLKNNVISQGVANFAYGINAQRVVDFYAIDNYFKTLAITCYNVIGGAPAAQNSINVYIRGNQCYNVPTGMNVGDYTFGIYIDGNIFYNTTTSVSIAPAHVVYGFYNFAGVTTGGANYAIGNTITLANATGGITQVAPVVLTVTSVSGGAVTGATVTDWGGFWGTLTSGQTLGTWTQASTSGSGTGGTFTLGGAVNNSSSLKLRLNDFDTTTTGVFLRNFANVSFSGDWFSNYTGSGLRAENVTNLVCCGASQFYGNGASANGIVLGDGTATAPALNSVITDAVFSGGSTGLYLRSNSSNVNANTLSITNMLFTGINRETGVTNVNLGPALTFSNNTTSDYRNIAADTRWANLNTRFTFATLPACNGASSGFGTYITDGLTATPTFGAAAAGGATATVHVTCNGTSWVSM